MSRPLRIEFSGACYHVMNRVRRGEDIFSDHKDFESFVAIRTKSAELHKSTCFFTVLCLPNLTEDRK